MQEEIENKTVSMAMNVGRNVSRFTGRTLRTLVSKWLDHQKKPSAHGAVTPRGKQTVRQLAAQNQGMTSIEIADKGIRDFERIANQYGVDFAVRKVGGDKTKYMVFFKAKDADALTAAFAEYTDKQIQRNSRPSVIKRLRSIQAQIGQNAPNPVKDRRQERSL